MYVSKSPPPKSYILMSWKQNRGAFAVDDDDDDPRNSVPAKCYMLVSPNDSFIGRNCQQHY